MAHDDDEREQGQYVRESREVQEYRKKIHRKKQDMRLLEELFLDGNWFRFPRMFLKFLKGDEAILLAYLINISNWTLCQHRRKNWSGWFYCRQKTMLKDIGFAPRKQSRIISILRRRRLILHRRRGFLAKRYFKINYIVIFRQMRHHLD